MRIVPPPRSETSTIAPRRRPLGLGQLAGAAHAADGSWWSAKRSSNVGAVGDLGGRVEQQLPQLGEVGQPVGTSAKRGSSARCSRPSARGTARTCPARPGGRLTTVVAVGDREHEVVAGPKLRIAVGVRPSYSWSCRCSLTYSIVSAIDTSIHCPARSLALVQRGQHGDRHLHAGVDVGVAQRIVGVGRAAASPCDFVIRPRRRRPGRTPGGRPTARSPRSRDRDVDQPRVAGPQRRRSEPQALHHAGAVVLDDDVAVVGQLGGQLDAARRGQVDADVALAGVLLDEVRRQPVDPRVAKRVRSPAGGSSLMTSAPRSGSMRVRAARPGRARHDPTPGPAPTGQAHSLPRWRPAGRALAPRSYYPPARRAGREGPGLPGRHVRRGTISRSSCSAGQPSGAGPRRGRRARRLRDGRPCRTRSTGSSPTWPSGSSVPSPSRCRPSCPRRELAEIVELAGSKVALGAEPAPRGWTVCLPSGISARRPRRRPAAGRRVRRGRRRRRAARPAGPS